MSVIPLTVFFSLLLAGTFVVLFARTQRRQGFTSAERDSLLPLADETPRPIPVPVGDHEHHHHDQAAGGCGCRDGLRPPCVGCLRQHGRPAPATRLS